ncbi:MAG: hypothetical protein JO051_06945 [Acidobacteriaceae bacterium]|nr:hypothetical protein [Acidobacteriaceae bacterium]
MAAFYATIAAAIVVGAGLDFTPLDPIKTLIWSAIINGVAGMPIVAMIALLTSRKVVTRDFHLNEIAVCTGLARDRGHGGCSDRHVCDFGELTDERQA